MQNTITELQIIIQEREDLQKDYRLLEKSLEKIKQDAINEQAEAKKIQHEHEEAIRNLQLQLDDKQAEIEEKTEELTRLRKEMAANEKTALDERDNLHTTIQQHLSRIEELEKQYKMKVEEITRINVELARTVQAIEQLKRQQHEDAENITELNRQLMTEKESNGELQANLTSEKQIVAELREQCKLSTEAIDMLNERISNEQISVTALRKQLVTETNCVALLQDKLKSVNEDSASMKERIEMLDAKAAKLIELEQAYQCIVTERDNMVSQHTAEQQQLLSEVNNNVDCITF